jgi:hypothetical protein
VNKYIPSSGGLYFNIFTIIKIMNIGMGWSACHLCLSENWGTMTFRIMTLSITTLSIMTLSILTLGILTLSIMTFIIKMDKH